MAEAYDWPEPFEELDHTADVGVRVHGRDADECLARLVLSLSSLILGGSGSLSAEATRALEIEPADRLSMAVDVLRELLYVFDTEHVLPVRCVVHRFDEESGVLLELAMAPCNEDEHDDITDLKAVTWHHAVFEPEGDGFIAQIIYDV